MRGREIVLSAEMTTSCNHTVDLVLGESAPRKKKGATKGALPLLFLAVDDQPRTASTLTVFTPSAGGGTMSPSIGLPSTVSDTLLPAPFRFTEIS